MPDIPFWALCGLLLGVVALPAMALGFVILDLRSLVRKMERHRTVELTATQFWLLRAGFVYRRGWEVTVVDKDGYLTAPRPMGSRPDPDHLPRVVLRQTRTEL